MSAFLGIPRKALLCAMSESDGAITAIRGIRVGHYTDAEHATGCTVLLFEGGAVGGVDVRGGAPGTRETDLLRPGTLVERVDAIVLSGGSAYGLDAASGVMRYLEERGIGFPVGKAVVPIVPAAILLDLGLITHAVRPGLEEGYKACEAASSDGVVEGSVGAGTGATVGKTFGLGRAVKGGMGTACLELRDGLLVGAIVAVNAAGSVVDPESGRVLAGPRREDGKGFHDTVALITGGGEEMVPASTTIGVVATNATLTKEEANRLAMMGQNGMVLAVRPCHTMGDGDVVFAAATGSDEEALDRRELSRLGAAASRVMAQAITRAITKATGLGGVPSAGELGVA